MTEATRAQRLRIDAPPAADAARILTPEALALLQDVCARFGPERKRLLADAGELPDFLPETAAVRAAGDWKVAPIPADLLDRRVEITGPVERKMIINALNSGAKAFMADFEDSNAPSWANRSAARSICLTRCAARSTSPTPEGKAYRLNEQDRRR
jgi:malate synthase